jgi:hypothetical protein
MQMYFFSGHTILRLCISVHTKIYHELISMRKIEIGMKCPVLTERKTKRDLSGDGIVSESRRNNLCSEVNS